MSLKKIILTSVLLTALSANADTQSTQQTPEDIKILCLKRDVELQQQNVDIWQNNVTTSEQKLRELLATKANQKDDNKYKSLLCELHSAELHLRWAKDDLNTAKQNLYAYEHPIKSVILSPAIIGGTVGLGLIGGVAYVAFKK